MFANNILLFLVAGFTKTTEQTFKQIQLNNQKTELAFRLDKWTKKAEQYISSSKFPGKWVLARNERRITLAGQASYPDP